MRTTMSRPVTQTDVGMGYGLEMSPDGLLLCSEHVPGV